MTPSGDLRSNRWPGYSAAICAFLFAAVSFYWGLGGTLGLETVSQEAVELSKSGNVWVLVSLLFVGIVKVAGGFLALALVQPWGCRMFRRWMLLAAGWAGAVLLLLYGGVQIAVQLLVLSGVIRTPANVDWRGFYGHLFIWNPWFLLWGILLAMATLSFTRVSGTDRSPVRVAGRPSCHSGSDARLPSVLPSCASESTYRGRDAWPCRADPRGGKE